MHIQIIFILLIISLPSECIAWTNKRIPPVSVNIDTKSCSPDGVNVRRINPKLMDKENCGRKSFQRRDMAKLVVSVVSPPMMMRPDQSNAVMADAGAETIPIRQESSRRKLWVNGVLLTFIGAFGLAFAKKAQAAGKLKSRSEGYAVQKSPTEWRSILTTAQYDVLRNGATETPYSSILEGEKRPGIYSCAGCGTPLFDAKDKFKSGTGWPSFANALEGVEVEEVGVLQENLAGAELRCKTCGGHLGDVFKDGFLFVGTPAFVTGKRYCIDGVALVFRPAGGEEVVIGDTAPPPNPVTASFSTLLQPPKIAARNREES